MLIWIILFIIIISASFILAIKSMRDYHEDPHDLGLPYSLYLVQQPASLTTEVLEQLYQALSPQQGLLSFERLFKGQKKALLIYGPTTILAPFTATLDLLELEEYSDKIKTEALSWEIGLKTVQTLNDFNGQLFSQLPTLTDQEQLWWQVIVQPESDLSNKLKQSIGSLGKNSSSNTTEPRFTTAVRVVAQAEDKSKVHSLKEQVSQAVRQAGLAILPQAYTSSQVVSFYQVRSLPKATSDQRTTVLPMAEVLKLLGY